MIVAAACVGLPILACITVKMPGVDTLPTPTPLATPKPLPAVTGSPDPAEESAAEWMAWGGGAVALAWSGFGLYLRQRRRKIIAAASEAIARSPPGD